MKGRPPTGRVRISKARIRDLTKLEDVLPLKRVADVLGVDVRTVYRWCRFQDAPHIEMGSWKYKYKKWSVKRDEFIKWLVETGRHRPRKEY